MRTFVASVGHVVTEERVPGRVEKRDAEASGMWRGSVRRGVLLPHAADHSEQEE
jgi:hypothetical protein